MSGLRHHHNVRGSQSSSNPDVYCDRVTKGLHRYYETRNLHIKVRPKAAQLPMFRLLHQTPLHRVPVHVTQLLNPLALAPDIEIIEPGSITYSFAKDANEWGTRPPVYIGKEADRHRDEGEDLSLLEFNAIQYRQKGYWTAVFGSTGPPDSSWERYNKTPIALRPGSTISAFWSLHDATEDKTIFRKAGKWIENLLRGLSFVPGKYTLTVVGGYWDRLESAQNYTPDWHTESIDMQETISASQTTIFFGAALGGVFAFLLVWKANPSLYSKMHVLSAVLLSIIVTILLARLADSQFIIRVTVNDLWGAMAVGFLVRHLALPFCRSSPTC